MRLCIRVELVDDGIQYTTNIMQCIVRVNYLSAVYAKGSVFEGKKTNEAPTNQPVTVSPSQESSFSSSSSASREGPVVISPSTSSLSVATVAESDQGVGQKTNPLVFHTPNEGKTSPATEQPLPGILTAHEVKEKKGISSVLLNCRFWFILVIS